MDNPLLQHDAPLPDFAAIQPEHVEPAIRAILDDNRRTIHELLASGASGWSAVIAPIERMQHRLARTWSPVGHLNGVANSDALRAAYNACLPLLTAYHTPGHTRGATTWIANLAVDGRSYLVVFPDGAGFNPGYRLAKNPSYPGIADDYRRTHHMLEMLKPDIWLAQHNEYYDLAGKRQRAQTEGVNAWIDPEGYRRFIAGRKREFEDQVDEELGASKGDAK